MFLFVSNSVKTLLDCLRASLLLRQMATSDDVGRQTDMSSSFACFIANILVFYLYMRDMFSS